jgi:hypothetical protein
MNDQPKIAKSIFIIMVGSIFGFWLYVILASFLGVIKAPFWWGGKGWFLPGFGTIATIVGAVPLCYIARWIFKRSMTLISERRLLSVGLIHGFCFVLALQLVSILIGIMVQLVEPQLNKIIEIMLIISKVSFAFLISGTLAAFIVTRCVNRQSGHI